ncbi:hypothetical protein ACWEJP_23635 [Streptomyces sp. NPDC004749]
MSSQRLRRWSATVTAAVTALPTALLATVLVTAPAQAADAAAPDGPVLNFHVARPEVGLPQPADGVDPAQIGWSLSGDADGGTAEDVVVGVDVSGIASFADFRGASCAGTRCFWPAKDIAPDGDAGGLLDVFAKPDAPLGTTGTARLFATSSNATVVETTVRVTVGTVELSVNWLPDTDSAVPGSTLDAPITVSNAGSLPARGAILRLVTTPGLGFAQRFANCAYGTTGDEVPGQTLGEAVCHLGPVEPGKRYRLSTAVGLDVKRTALFEFLHYRITPASASAPTRTAASASVPASAPVPTAASVLSAPNGAAHRPVLSLVPDGSAPPSGSEPEHVRWIVNAVNTADIAVTGDTVRAEPGDEVTLTAKVRNGGPASVNLLTSDDHLAVLVDIPEGTTAVRLPKRCGVWTGGGMGEPAPGARQYVCTIGRPFDVGQVASLPFTVRVDADAPAATSGDVRSMTVWGGKTAYDPNEDNNTDAFTVLAKRA